MAAIQDYRCPCCGRAVALGSVWQKMKCHFCEAEFGMEALAGYGSAGGNGKADDMRWETAYLEGWQGDRAGRLRSYVCKSCGGEVIGGQNTAAGNCPFCGGAVEEGQFLGTIKPNYVVPFRVDKKTAATALQKYCGGKRLIQKECKGQGHIDKVKGLYVPFWLLEGSAEIDMRYRASKIKAWSDSDYHYTENSLYAVRRVGAIEFERMPMVGASKMPEGLTGSLGPFDFSGAVDFQKAGLAGYLAEHGDVDAEQTVWRANEWIRRGAAEAFERTVEGYAAVAKESGSVQLRNGKVRYALFPVWLWTIRWKGDGYLIAMNGQSGKIAGDLPFGLAAGKKRRFGAAGRIGAAAMAAGKRRLKAAYMEEAGKCFKKASIKLTGKDEWFLYRHVGRQERPKEGGPVQRDMLPKC